jgi:hypothetical protein
MNAPWFDGNMVGAIIGSGIGLLGASLGLLCGFDLKGRLKKLVYGIVFGSIGACLLLLGVGAVALMHGQPRQVWYALGWPGLIGIMVFCSVAPAVFTAYRKRGLPAGCHQ